MQKDYGKYFGSFMMFWFGVLALYRWHQTQLIFFLLLLLRDFAAGYFFLKRSPATVKSGRSMTVLAYVSAAMPLVYLSPTIGISSAMFLASDLLAILGFLFVALATIELGTSIGVSPAKREYVTTGIYQWVKHPMYVGYIISEVGLCLINPMNVGIAALSFSLYWFRGQNENGILIKE